VNQTTGTAIMHTTYFALHSIFIEHLELLEHRAASTAGKTMLFCVVYSRKNVVLSGCQCLFSLILVVKQRICDTYY